MQNRFAKKVDRSQSAIVKAFRSAGTQVVVTNSGNDFPDLLVCKKSWKLVEVKEPDGSFSRGQLVFLATATGPVDIVVGEDDAMMSLKEDRFLSPNEQGRIGIWLATNDQETISVQKLLTMIGRLEKKSGKGGSERRKSCS